MPAQKSVALDYFFDMTPETAAALSKAPALEELNIDSSFEMERWIERGYMRIIGENANLRDIRSMGSRAKDTIEGGLRETRIPERIVKMINFIEAEEDRVWLRIFEREEELLRMEAGEAGTDNGEEE
ncbi:uncharacterized protein PHACADRAFT_201882 [Phanerochaete carnosa HHB-10118-sp]|uniref:Uncharacterized protein n=1 Tax=Phanerochaete carnosa (strain HHB-10118-sp) TaxID=650164 RepID=K5VR67_PHACS|nr:uncharacterized protein PHACADRAFT_201882 [Phanerochaete carnosa HHB-10118-sp]EKM49230.1 hypothetical protein PHACADRAFT_201882 [Phanerochaete carnosa HHB-10118-sp]